MWPALGLRPRPPHRRPAPEGRPCETCRLANDELGVTASEAQLDRAGGQLERDLLGGCDERVLQGEPDAGVDGRGQALGDGPRFVPTRLRSDHELLVDRLYVGP